METNFETYHEDEIIKKIYSEPLKEPGTIRLIPENEVDLQTIFGMLLRFTKYGFIKFEGPDFKIDFLNKETIDIVKEYVKSINFQLFIDITPLKKDENLPNLLEKTPHLSTIKPNSSALNEYRFHINTGKFLYTLSYDLLI